MTVSKSTATAKITSGEKFVNTKAREVAPRIKVVKSCRASKVWIDIINFPVVGLGSIKRLSLLPLSRNLSG